MPARRPPAARPRNVADAPEGDDQHRGDEHVSLQQPQEVADVGRLQVIEVDVPVTVTPQFTSMSISPDGPRPPAPYRPVEPASRGAGPGTAMC
jgi:hypothetical protein